MIFYLLLIALVLFFLEIFTPGGILAAIGGILIIAASVMAFGQFGIMASILIIFGGGIAGILLFFVEIKLLAKSPFGRIIRHDSRQTEKAKPVGSMDLIGKQGSTLTTLAPSGRVSIDGKTFDATSLGSLIKKGSSIEVVRTETYNLIVKEL